MFAMFMFPRHQVKLSTKMDRLGDKEIDDLRESTILQTPPPKTKFLNSTSLRNPPTIFEGRNNKKKN